MYSNQGHLCRVALQGSGIGVAMKNCRTCTHYADPECGLYSKIPPAGYAAKCKNYIKDVSKQEPEPEPEKPARDCPNCAAYDSGWCLRLDHPDWKYNFVKIKPDTKCRLEE